MEEKLDKNSKILAFNDLVLDLSSLTSHTHDFSFYITKKLNYNFPGKSNF